MSHLLENSNNGGEVTIPLVSISAESNTIIRKIIATGCSCGECKKKMWTQLKRTSIPVPLIVNDEVDTSHSIQTDTCDGPTPTIDLVGAGVLSSNSSQSVPIDPIQIESLEKESAILKMHMPLLLQKWRRDDGTKPVLLCQAINRKPFVLDAFLEMLSERISFVSPSVVRGSQDEIKWTTIHMNMQDLLPEKKDTFRETKVLVHLVTEIEDLEVKGKILAHPLITTFATLKYQNYQFVSVMLLVYHLLFGILLTNYAFHAFLAEYPAVMAKFTKLSSIVLVFMAVISSFKTVTAFFASGIKFDLRTTRNFGEIFSVFVAFFMCLLPSFGWTIFSHSFNKDLTAFSVMSSWLVVLSYLTKFNQTAVYVQTFFQIVKNYIHFLWMVAVWQLIALSASYSLIFDKSEKGLTHSGDFFRSLIRVLTGRMNYNDYTAQEADLENPISVFNYFFFYFVLSTVMMAMIIGLAQNGLESIRSSSAVSVLCQVIKDIAELEWIITRLEPILPQNLFNWLHKKISITDVLLNDNSKILEIRPHYYESKGKIPKNLKKLIYKHLVERGATCA